MRIKMTSRQRGSPHGYDAFWYEPNCIYDAGSSPPMTDSLALTFLREHWAIDVTRKDLGSAPENKARKRGRPRKVRIEE